MQLSINELSLNNESFLKDIDVIVEKNMKRAKVAFEYVLGDKCDFQFYYQKPKVSFGLMNLEISTQISGIEVEHKIKFNLTISYDKKGGTLKGHINNNEVNELLDFNPICIFQVIKKYI